MEALSGQQHGDESGCVEQDRFQRKQEVGEKQIKEISGWKRVRK